MQMQANTLLKYFLIAPVGLLFLTRLPLFIAPTHQGVLPLHLCPKFFDVFPL